MCKQTRQNQAAHDANTDCGQRCDGCKCWRRHQLSKKNRLYHSLAPHSGSARRKGHGFRTSISITTSVPQCPFRFDRSEEHTSELQSIMRISNYVFCMKKKKRSNTNHITKQVNR